MSIGPDFKEVLEEIGTSVLVIRDEGVLSGEYMIPKPNRQVTKPFIQEFFLEGRLAYDTEIEGGDVVQLISSPDVFLVMNKNGRDFEGECFEQDVVMYKANVSGEICRAVEVEVDYDTKQSFPPIRTNSYALITESMFGNEMLDTEQGRFQVNKKDLYVPHKYGMQVGDRYCPVSGENYMVDSVMTRRFENVDMVTLVDDTR